MFSSPLGLFMFIKCFILKYGVIMCINWHILKKLASWTLFIKKLSVCFYLVMNFFSQIVCTDPSIFYSLLTFRTFHSRTFLWNQKCSAIFSKLLLREYSLSLEFLGFGNTLFFMFLQQKNVWQKKKIKDKLFLIEKWGRFIFEKFSADFHLGIFEKKNVSYYLGQKRK